ncbi:hypothetical protein [Nocardiopsis coralliicola]
MDDETLALLLEEVVSLRDRVLALETLLAEGASAAAPDTVPSPAYPTSVAWDRLDTRERVAALESVHRWVTVDLAGAPGTDGLLLPCWYRHPHLVQELLDLRAEWRAAHGPHGSAHRALTVRTVDVPRSVERVERMLSRCTGNRHDDAAAAPPPFDSEGIRTQLPSEGSDPDSSPCPPPPRS